MAVQRILVIGDAGRGKTTLAAQLSQKTGLPFYSTDDFFWQKKYSQVRGRVESLKQIQTVYDQEAWIVEGTTRSLIEPGLERAELIVYLCFRTLLEQYWILLKRFLRHPGDHPWHFVLLCLHVLYKRYGWGYERGKPHLKQIALDHPDKSLTLHSFKAIDTWLQSLN